MHPGNTPSPWVAGAPTVLLGNQPTLDNVSQLMCIWGGVITFTFPGEVTVEVPRLEWWPLEIIATDSGPGSTQMHQIP